MKWMRSVTFMAGSCLLALTIAGCFRKAPKPPPPPPPTKAAIVVSADVNPDSAGRPSPIVVRLYQLKEEGVAAYRNLNNSKWKALSPAPESGLLDFVRKHKLIVSVGKSEVKITPAN
jgi:predicted component of type VI protein secretion system